MQVGLLYAMLDFERDAETFAAYDRMTAHELFIRMGLSKRLVMPPSQAPSAVPRRHQCKSLERIRLPGGFTKPGVSC